LFYNLPEGGPSINGIEPTNGNLGTDGKYFLSIRAFLVKKVMYAYDKIHEINNKPTVLLVTTLPKKS
jgi:hypothetical protein